MKKLFSDIISTIAIAFLKGISILPMNILFFISDFLFIVLYKLSNYRVGVVRENIQKSFPQRSKDELKTIEIAYYRYLADLIMETVKGFTIGKKELLKRMNFSNPELMNRLVENEQSAIMVMGHQGNWEWISRAAPLLVRNNIICAYKPLTNRGFDRLMYDTRAKFGVRLVPMQQIPRVLSSEKKPYLLILLADQSPTDSETSIWVNFLNRETAVLPGIEKLALKYKLPVFFNEVRVLKRCYYTCKFKLVCEADELKNPSEITKRHCRILEENINERPAYWLWSHRRWKLKKN